VSVIHSFQAVSGVHALGAEGLFSRSKEAEGCKRPLTAFLGEVNLLNPSGNFTYHQV
jgi:hypothetical protein